MQSALESVQNNLLSICMKKLDQNQHKKLFGIVCSTLMNMTDIRENFSKKEIEEHLRRILDKTENVQRKKRKEVIEREVSKLGRFFKDEIGKWNIIVPLENMKLNQRILKIGNISFYTLTNHRRKEITKRLRKILLPNPNYSQQEKEALVMNIVKEVVEPALGKVCAEVMIKGRVEMVFPKALRIIRDSVLAMKLYRNIQDDVFGRYFDLMGGIPTRALRVMLGFSDQKGFTSEVGTLGTFFPYEIDQRRKDFMKKWGVNEILNMLTRTDLTELEHRLLSSILWFGRACEVQLLDEERRKKILSGEKASEISESVLGSFGYYDRFIKLIIALEALLVFDKTEPIQNNVAERCALFLGREYDERKYIKKRIKNLYALRSKLVHHGHVDISKEELDELTVITQKLILNILKKKKKLKIRSKKDFKDWFEKRKLTY